MEEIISSLMDKAIREFPDALVLRVRRQFKFTIRKDFINISILLESCFVLVEARLLTEYRDKAFDLTDPSSIEALFDCLKVYLNGSWHSWSSIP